jgi:hypothetical protein
MVAVPDELAAHLAGVHALRGDGEGLLQLVPHWVAVHHLQQEPAGTHIIKAT